MKTIGQLIKTVAVNYDGMHEYNRKRMDAEYDSDEYNGAGEVRDIFRRHLEGALEELKALGIDVDLLV